jgi:D-alanyl-D-alanine carboxypeptidase
MLFVLSTELTRMLASRAVRFIALCLGVAFPVAVSAATPALVIEVDSGKVLYAERATDPWYPASITKLMTAYVALSAVREGKVSIDTPLTISEVAHATPPSKMGFPPGTEVTLDNALKIIMVKSANDVSIAIAEGIGGSVEGFADMMNATAQRLGMRESHFVNPHGLPDERQHTSARDMAILGRALLRDFPEHAGYFRIGAIKFGRRVMKNHNGLMGRYPGADGMKTGFICASGFNVVASATRNGRRLITVVMGSTSAAERTVKAAALLDRGFSSFGLLAPKVEDLPRSNMVNAPNMRPLICERRGPPPAEEETTVATPQSDDTGQNQTSTLAYTSGSTPGARPQLGPRARFEPVIVWTGRTPPSALAVKEDEEKATKTTAAPVKRKPLARAKPPLPAAARAFAGTDPKPIIDEGRSKGTTQESVAAKPKAKAGAAAAVKAKPGAAKKPQTAHAGSKAAPQAKQSE